MGADVVFVGISPDLASIITSEFQRQHERTDFSISPLYRQSAYYSVSTSVLWRDQSLLGVYSCETFPLPEMAANQFRRRNFGNDRPTTLAMPCWRVAQTTADFHGGATASSSRPKTAMAVHLLSRLIESKDGNLTPTPPKKLDVSSVRSQKNAKKVSFSDEVGLALTSVRTFSSSFSCPFPDGEELRSCSSTERSSTTAPSFVLNFRQPRTCMLTFVEKLEKNSVQLGSIEIKDGVIVGEIVVKNLAYEKTVFVRYTGTRWNSFTDVYASYVSRKPEPNLPGCDAFEFQFPVPLEVHRDGCVEFAVCYEVDGMTFWDNGGDGKNYRVTKLFSHRSSTDSRRSSHSHDVCPSADDAAAPGSGKTTDRTVFDIFQRTAVNWSEFTGWKNGINCTLPYW